MANFRKVVANVLTTDFRKACQIVTAKIPQLKENEVLVKARYAGINATDINVTAGRYGPAGQPLPFDVGLEGKVAVYFCLLLLNQLFLFVVKKTYPFPR